MDIVALDPNSVRTSPQPWQAIAKAAIRESGELLRRLGLPQNDSKTNGGERQFSVFVPEPWLQRIRPGDPRDPLLLQVLPRPEEDLEVAGFKPDAVGDLAAEHTPGLIQKYDGRALLITRGVCAIHCRYCFRRHYPYDAAPVSLAEFDAALDAIRADASIDEVILSGGDPLMMVDHQLGKLVRLLDSIDHIKRLRIHTRLPIVIPQRVTGDLLKVLEETRLTRFFVLHINHPQEIDNAVRSAVARLLDCRMTLLNQSVLLKDVNDDVETLVELSRQLIAINCLPYYLHQLDRVAGTAHFEVAEEVGRGLVGQMRSRLPGYAVPRYVREVTGDSAKRIMV